MLNAVLEGSEFRFASDEGRGRRALPRTVTGGERCVGVPTVPSAGDALLDLLQLERRFETALFHQSGAVLVVRLQRFAGPSVCGERSHEQAAGSVAPGVCADVGAQGRHRLAGSSGHE